MSILHESTCGWFISHENYINNTIKSERIYAINPELFQINVPYKNKCKKKKFNEKVLEEPAKKVKTQYEKFLKILRENGFLLPRLTPSAAYIEMNNSTAAKAAQLIYDQSGKSPILSQLYGENRSGNVVIQKINNANYVIPDKCQFYCNDIVNIASKLKEEKFDFILLDPPWWNKFIRRKRKRQSTTHAYNMIFNEELQQLPIENLLKLNQEDGATIVAIWCTNSVTHFNYLKDVLLPKWGLNYYTTWYWVKITTQGELVTEFTEKNGKQPFEQIVIATRERRHVSAIEEEKLILSVPSAIHSHKPPIMEIIQKHFFSEDVTTTLEIFARYLLPNCCSYGNEVLRFQHESMFIINEDDKLAKEI